MPMNQSRQKEKDTDRQADRKRLKETEGDKKRQDEVNERETVILKAN